MNTNVRRGAWSIYTTGIFANTMLNAANEVNNLQIRRNRHNDDINVAEYGLYAFMGATFGAFTGLVWPITVSAIGLEKVLYANKK